MLPTLISDEALNQKLATRPAPNVTKAHIESRIADVEFELLADTLTMCAITLKNGFIVFGKSACVDPENYDKDIGERLAYDDAFHQLWPFFGFLLAERIASAHNLTSEAENTTETRNAGLSTLESAAHRVVSFLAPAIEKIHKESGVSSDVTNAVNNAIAESIHAAA